jgi:hypothetical protein
MNLVIRLLPGIVSNGGLYQPVILSMIALAPVRRFLMNFRHAELTDQWLAAAIVLVPVGLTVAGGRTPNLAYSAMAITIVGAFNLFLIVRMSWRSEPFATGGPRSKNERNFHWARIGCLFLAEICCFTVWGAKTGNLKNEWPINASALTATAASYVFCYFARKRLLNS